MKIIIGLLMACFLYAGTLYTIDKSQKRGEMKFLKLKSDKCYYKNSYIAQNNCYFLTGNIIIKAKKPIEDSFLEKNSLTFIRVLNQDKFISLYKYKGQKERVIESVNTLNRKYSEELEARVEWIKPRRLY